MKIPGTGILNILIPAIFVLVFVFRLPVQAQKQGNIWYFGNKAGISFNTSPPKVLVNSQASGSYGNATASDRNGNLLFYFAGGSNIPPHLNKQVFNRNHQPMPNGSGFFGADAPSLIVPWPGTQKYYLFTLHPLAGRLRNTYSLIDMSLQNGSGDVTAIKNVPLNIPSSVYAAVPAAVKHRNNRDYWVIFKKQGTDSCFTAFQVTPSGINPTPVISNIPTVGINLIASQDGRTLATTSVTDIEVYNFDPATGLVTYRYGVPMRPWLTNIIEFSPDGTKLYLVTQDPPPNWKMVLKQYDLTAGSGFAVQMSAQTVQGYDSAAYLNGSLQAAPDGKIYQIANGYNNPPNKYLNVIHRPNVSGRGCRVQLNAINLEPPNTGNHTAGIKLPTFVQGFFYEAKISLQQACFGDTTWFDLSNRAYADSVHWNFGDPASGALNQSTSYTTKHFYAAPGTYNVQAIVHYSYNADTLYQTVYVPTSITKPNLGNDTLLCRGDTLWLNAYQPGGSYEWQDSVTTDPVLAVTRTGTYWVEVSNGCGTRRDSINVRFDAPLANLGPDRDLCPGEQLVLKLNATGGQVRWQDGSSGQTFIVTQPGVYWVQVNNLCGQFFDTVRVTYKPSALNKWLPQDTVVCGNSLTIKATHPNAIYYRWQDGSYYQNYSVTTSGLYWLEITTACQTLRDSIRVTFNPKPPFRFRPDTTICSGDVYVLKAPPGLNYRWNTDDTTQHISITKGGFYKVNFDIVPGCSFSDSITVKEERCFPTTFLPNIITPNHDNLNDRFEPKSLEPGTWSLEIYNRWGVLLYKNENYTSQWPDADIPEPSYYYLLRNKQTGKTHKGWVEVEK
jgi:gliding motility-associated-like protein